jgi:aerobic carbon-monoxide dehydrogenase medium subunit
VILPRFLFLEPATFEEALQIVEKNKGEAVMMAGGTDLLVNLKRKVVKAGVVISLEKIDALKQINYSEAEGLTLGSMVRISELASTPVIKQKYPLLAIAANKLGSPQIRNRATVGGNVCTARPAGDTIGPLLAYGAEVQLVRGKESRWEPLAKFIVGPGKTTRKEGEILAAIKLKPCAADTGYSYIKYGVRKAMEIAMVSVTTNLTFEGKKCTSAAVILGAVGPVFMRSGDAEATLCAKEITEAMAEQAAEQAGAFCTPITDTRATAEYRCDLVKALTKRSIMEAAGKHLKQSSSHKQEQK